MAQAEATIDAGRTAWARNLATPVRDFLGTETGGASVLLAATVLALLWANSPWSHSYESLWSTKLAVTIGSGGISADLRQWVNEGLMTFFFLVVGLEAKREFDLGELRERRRLAIPMFAALGGMTLPVLIYLAFNAGGPGAHGWGAAMSTDTAFALGALALLTPRAATRLRVFLLTLAVVDDLCALLVIATVYTTHVSIPALAIAVVLFGVLLALRYAPEWRRPASFVVAVGLWTAMFKSGIWGASTCWPSRVASGRTRLRSVALPAPAWAFWGWPSTPNATTAARVTATSPPSRRSSAPLQSRPGRIWRLPARCARSCAARTEGGPRAREGLERGRAQSEGEPGAREGPERLRQQGADSGSRSLLRSRSGSPRELPGRACGANNPRTI